MGCYLELNNIVKVYPGVRALDNVSISVELGKVHALLGENGAGKSTLIKTMAGAIKPTSGTITISGNSFSSMTPALSKSMGIGVIYQELNLVPALSVWENIFIGNEVIRSGLVDRAKMREQAIAIFEGMEIEIDVDANVGSLSIAYQQMVEIAKALSRDLKILIMDEPTSSLSKKEVEQMFRVVKRLKERNIGIIYISHRLDELDGFADVITVLRDGRLIQTLSAEGVTHDDMIRLMIGRDLTLNYFPDRSDAVVGNLMLEVKYLSMQNYIKNVNFQVHSGEIVGLAGLVGAGRTTVVRGIFGADKLEQGEIILEGKKLSIKTPIDAIRAGIVMVPEDRKQHGVLLAMSCKHNISFPSINTGLLTKWGVIKQKQEQAISTTQIQSLRVKTPSPHQKVRLLSGGNQQKLVIGKWLSMNPKVLIFDEPTRGIDVGAKHEIYEIIDMMARKGAAVIIISSEMPELMGVSDRIVCMYEGSVTGEIARKDATQEKILRLCSGILD